jgi:hypothetical protein
MPTYVFIKPSFARKMYAGSMNADIGIILSSTMPSKIRFFPKKFSLEKGYAARAQINNTSVEVAPAMRRLFKVQRRERPDKALRKLLSTISPGIFVAWVAARSKEARKSQIIGKAANKNTIANKM